MVVPTESTDGGFASFPRGTWWAWIAETTLRSVSFAAMECCAFGRIRVIMAVHCGAREAPKPLPCDSSLEVPVVSDGARLQSFPLPGTAGEFT